MARRSKSRDGSEGRDFEGGLRDIPATRETRFTRPIGARASRGNQTTPESVGPFGSRFVSPDLSAFADYAPVPIRGVVTSAPFRRGQVMPRAVAATAFKAAGVSPRVIKALGIPTAPPPKNLVRTKFPEQAGKAFAVAVKRAETQERKPVVSQAKPSTTSREERVRENCKARPEKPARGGSGKSRRFIPWCR